MRAVAVIAQIERHDAPLDPEIRLDTLSAEPEALAEQVVRDLRARGVVE